MPDLAERVRDELRAVAEATTPSDRLDGLVRRRVRIRRNRRRRRAALAAVAAVVALAVALGQLVRSDGGDARRVVAGPPPPDLSGVMLLHPTWLPDGLQPVGAAGGAHPGQPVWEGRAELMEPGQHGIRSVFLWWRPAPAGTDPLAPFRTTGRRTTVRGAPAVESIAEGWIAWVDRDRDRVLLFGGSDSTQGASEPLDGVRALVEQLVPPPPGHLNPFRAALPGFARVESGGRLPVETNARALAYADGRGRAVIVRLSDGFDPPKPGTKVPGFEPQFPLRGTYAWMTQVRGRIAFDWPEGRPPRLPRTDRELVWIEPNGVLVMLDAAGLSQDELLAVARSMRPMAPRDFLALSRRHPAG